MRAYIECLIISRTMDSGKKTGEFISVREHMSTFHEHFKVHSKHKTSLTMKYQEKGWIDYTDRPSHMELVTTALNRISLNCSHYYIFMAMLRSIVGMDVVIDKIEGMVAVRAEGRYCYITLFTEILLQR